MYMYIYKCWNHFVIVSNVPGENLKSLSTSRTCHLIRNIGMQNCSTMINLNTTKTDNSKKWTSVPVSGLWET